MADKLNIELPEYLLQFLVEPLFDAMDTVSGRLSSADSAELDMFQEVLSCIQRSCPKHNLDEWFRRWTDNKSVSTQDV